MRRVWAMCVAVLLGGLSVQAATGIWKNFTCMNTATETNLYLIWDIHFPLFNPFVKNTFKFWFFF